NKSDSNSNKGYHIYTTTDDHINSGTIHNKSNYKQVGGSIPNHNTFNNQNHLLNYSYNQMCNPNYVLKYTPAYQSYDHMYNSQYGLSCGPKYNRGYIPTQCSQ